MGDWGSIAQRPLGVEWLVDACQCLAPALRDVAKVEGVIEHIVRTLSLHPVSPPLLHRFPGEGGVTALVLLAESHLTIHTFPELASATLNLYCCRPRSELDWAAVLRDWLGAREVRVRSLVRGESSPAEPR